MLIKIRWKVRFSPHYRKLYDDAVLGSLWLSFQSFSSHDENLRTYKLLGIYLDDHLIMDAHCIKLGKKLTKSLYFLRRVQNILTKEALLSLNYAIFHAHLLYCPIVTSGISAQVLKKIKILQKKAIRTITKSKSREHTEPLFRQLKILPYDKIVQMSKLNFSMLFAIDIHPIPFNLTGKLTRIVIWSRNWEMQQIIVYPCLELNFFKSSPSILSLL